MPDGRSGNRRGNALAATALAVYIAGTAAGAAWIDSRACGFPRRLSRAFLGSVLGAAVAIGTASSLEGQDNGPAVVAGVVGFLGTPVGAAISLWRCD
jgi:hypothetical protein